MRRGGGARTAVGESEDESDVITAAVERVKGEAVNTRDVERKM